MACFNPLEGFRLRDGRFSRLAPSDCQTVPMVLACGGCIGCRLDKMREWQVRMVCESLSHENVLMAQLTYDDDNLPNDLSLNKVDYRLWLKRLRKFVGNKKIRFYLGAEYGDLSLRPHYHAILFGVGKDDFSDCLPYRKSGDHQLYKSEKFNELWGHGFCNFGDAKAGAFSYAAGYVVKKRTSASDARYTRVDPVSGKTWQVMPEFGAMSSGLGRAFFDEYRSDFAQSGFLVVDGKQVAIPPYFKNKLRNSFETSGAHSGDGFVIDDLEIAMAKRREFADSDDAVFNSTPERRAVREECQLIRVRAFERNRVSHDE